MKATRNIAIDTLRTLSIILVIGIHTSGDYVMNRSSMDGNYYTILALHCIVRMGVPLFVLISGAFVLGRAPYRWSDFYRHRLPRLLVPLMVWLPLYYIWIALKGDDVGGLASGLWRGDGFLHFWFLLMLLTLYLVTPLIDEILRRITTRRGTLTFAFGLLLFGIAAFAFDSTQGSRPFFPLYYLYFLGYYVLGYALRKYPVRDIRGCAIGYFVSLPMLYAATLISERNGFGDYPLDNLSPLIAMGSVCLFAIASSRRCEGVKPNILSHTSPDVMGIYIVHIAVLNVVTKPFLMFAPELMQVAWINVPIRLALVVLLSWCAVRILRHIPYISRTIA